MRNYDAHTSNEVKKKKGKHSVWKKYCKVFNNQIDINKI